MSGFTRGANKGPHAKGAKSAKEFIPETSLRSSRPSREVSVSHHAGIWVALPQNPHLPMNRLEPRASAAERSPSSRPSPPGEGESPTDGLIRLTDTAVQGFNARIMSRGNLTLTLSPPIRWERRGNSSREHAVFFGPTADDRRNG